MENSIREELQANPADVFKPKGRMRYREQYDVEQEEEAQERTATYNDEPSKTEQHHAADLDINEMMRRMGVGPNYHIPNAISVSDPRLFGDFTGEVDYREALDRVNHAKEQFMRLPAKMRERFSNDPAKLIAFLSNPENLEEGVRIGLLQKKAEEPPKAPEPAPKDTN